MAVTLDQQEIDEFLTEGHTIIFSSIDKDGFPHSVPLWYAYMDGHIYLSALGRSQRVKNLQRNQKVCCLVEAGDRWRDLKAVMVRGRVEVVEDREEQRRFGEILRDKYAPFREAPAAMPGRVQQHYAQSRVYYKVIPEKRLATWDNRKVRMG